MTYYNNSISDWKRLENGTDLKFTMPLASCHVPMTVEVLTTKDDAGKYVVLLYDFLGNNVYNGQCEIMLILNCTKNNNWKYILSLNHNEATEASVPLVRFSNDITNNQVRLWKITKTSATNMRVVCNDVVVANFNFETNSLEGYQKNKDTLSGQPKSVSIQSIFSCPTFVKDF